jgi:hypothetical protein
VGQDGLPHRLRVVGVSSRRTDYMQYHAGCVCDDGRSSLFGTGALVAIRLAVLVPLPSALRMCGRSLSEICGFSVEKGQEPTLDGSLRSSAFIARPNSGQALQKQIALSFAAWPLIGVAVDRRGR